MNAASYRSTLDDLKASDLVGFFEGWPSPPSPEIHLRILRNSWAVELACDRRSGKVIGFVNAVSDGFYSAYIPLLEVLPAHRGCGIGHELVRRMMDRCSHFYMVDVCCDEAIQGFYAKFGMTPVQGMCYRNYASQSGVQV